MKKICEPELKRDFIERTKTRQEKKIVKIGTLENFKKRYKNRF